MIAWHTSSILAARSIGLVSASLFITDSFSSSVSPAYLYIFVFKKLGETQLTLTPNLANSRAADFVIISRPALDMQYEIKPGYGLLPFRQEMLTTQPCAAMSISWKKLSKT